MTGRRAWWISALLAVVVVAAGAVGYAVVASRSPEPQPRADRPVILIPGYGGGAQGFAELAPALAAIGRPPTVLEVGEGTADLQTYAEVALGLAEELVASGADGVDLVGFSAGGLTARAAATDPRGEDLINSVVTLGTPHGGTDLAVLGAGFGACPQACQQMIPGSDFLAELPVADGSGDWLSIYSLSDEVIRPAESSQLDGAENLVIQDLCERDVPHGAVPTDPLTIEAVTQFLETGTIPKSCPR